MRFELISRTLRSLMRWSDVCSTDSMRHLTRRTRSSCCGATTAGISARSSTGIRARCGTKRRACHSIISRPGATAERCDRAVSLIDLYPTLCDLCELPKPERLDGTSLVPLLDDPSAEGHPPAVTVMGGKHAAVRDDRWRLIRYGNGEDELYDHASDRNEWTNLADEEDTQWRERSSRGVSSAGDPHLRGGSCRHRTSPAFVRCSTATT